MSLIPGTRLLVRAAQLAASVAALALAPLRYASSGFQLDAKSTAAIYLTNYAALLCALYYLVVLQVPKLSMSAPTVRNQRMTDCLLLAVLVLGATLELTHDALPHCEIREAYFEKRGSTVFRCGMKTASVVATYANATLFLLSAVWSFMRDSVATATPSSVVEDYSTNDNYASVATPAKSTGGSPTMSTATERRRSFEIARRLGRVVQLLSSVISVAVLLVGYRLYESGSVTSMPMFAILAAYSSALYSLWHIVAVETAKLSARPSVLFQRAADGALTVVMLLAAILLSCSSSVRDCSSTGDCGHLTAGFVLLFVCAAAHVGSLGLSFAAIEDDLSPRASATTFVGERGDSSSTTVNAV